MRPISRRAQPRARRRRARRAPFRHWASEPTYASPRAIADRVRRPRGTRARACKTKPDRGISLSIQRLADRNRASASARRSRPGPCRRPRDPLRGTNGAFERSIYACIVNGAGQTGGVAMVHARQSPWRAVRAWLHRWLAPTVQEVPPALYACEFACRRRDCRQQGWLGCEKRLRYERALQPRADAAAHASGTRGRAPVVAGAAVRAGHD